MGAKPKSKRGRVVAVVAGIVALVCLGTAALGVGGYYFLNTEGTPSASPSKTKKPAAPSPIAGDPVHVAQAWVVERITEALEKQAKALIGGDEAGYLAIVDPKLHDATRKRFSSLHAMGAAKVTDEVSGVVYHNPQGGWEVDVTTNICFGNAPTCGDGPAGAKLEWRIDDGLAVLTKYEANKKMPHPWQLDELVAKVGERAVVATTKEFASKLDDLLSKADTAARVADRFARGDKIPSRYVVYYAGKTEWKEWFNWNPPDWSGGAALNLSDDRWDLILNSQGLQPSHEDNLLRHELTHSASLAGHFGDHEDLWWMVEGIAEVAEMDGNPVSRYSNLPYAKALIEDGTEQDLIVEAPGASTDPEVVSGKYGLAFLGMRCISEKHGEQKFVEFFHEVVHDGKKLDEVAPAVLGVEWPALNRECFDYAKQAAR